MKLITSLSIAAVLFLAFAGTSGARYQPYMESALQHLSAARANLKSAERDKGGHRVRAIQLIDEAIAEVRRGEAVGNR